MRLLGLIGRHANPSMHERMCDLPCAIKINELNRLVPSHASYLAEPAPRLFKGANAATHYIMMASSSRPPETPHMYKDWEELAMLSSFLCSSLHRQIPCRYLLTYPPPRQGRLVVDRAYPRHELCPHWALIGSPPLSTQSSD